jgi:tetratricopeptide (TPR) repeat protein
MSKPMAVTLPFVLLLLDYWPLQRFRVQGSGLRVWNLVLEKIPFFILAAGGCALTLHAQQIAIVSTAGLPVSERLLHTPAAYNHYLASAFWPRHLAVYYPYQKNLPAPIIAWAVVVLVSVTALALMNWRRRPWLLTGWLWFLGTLVPVIGLVQVGDQAWADRYTYLPLIGLSVMVVWLAAEFVKRRFVLQAASGLIAAALMTITWKQLGYWHNTRTLFEHANAVTPKNYMAITMLGSILAQEKKYTEAMEYYRTALSYQPTFPEAHFFLGAVYDEQGRADEALGEYQKALWFKPTQEQAHIFMGMILGRQKKYEEAKAQYYAALQANPDSAPAQNNLARLLHSQGRLDEAMVHYREALEIDPKLALAHNNLGILLIQKNQLAEGTAQLREAMRLSPTNAETRLNLAMALSQQRQWPEAAELFSQTVRGDLPDPKAHYEYATTLACLKRTREAMTQYATALLLQPDYPEALDGLAWIAATDGHGEFRNGTEAVRMAERACELTRRQDPEKLRTLAAAYAEAGRFPDAAAALQTAIELATQANRRELLNQCFRMRDKFLNSEPWREL